jgi:hypothetical protein
MGTQRAPVTAPMCSHALGAAPYLWRYVMRPRVRSYGDTSIFT